MRAQTPQDLELDVVANQRDLMLNLDLKPIINYLIDAFYEFMILKSGRDESFRLK